MIMYSMYTQHCFVPNGRRSQQFIENVAAAI